MSHCRHQPKKIAFKSLRFVPWPYLEFTLNDTSEQKKLSGHEKERKNQLKIEESHEEEWKDINKEVKQGTKNKEINKQCRKKKLSAACSLCLSLLVHKRSKNKENTETLTTARKKQKENAIYITNDKTQFSAKCSRRDSFLCEQEKAKRSVLFCPPESKLFSSRPNWFLINLWRG